MNPSYTDLLACFATSNLSNAEFLQSTVDYILKDMVPDRYFDLLSSYNMLNDMGAFICPLNLPIIIIDKTSSDPEFVFDAKDDNDELDDDNEQSLELDYP